MSSIYGNKLKISIFGGSHTEAIGMTLDGFPAGYHVDYDALSAFMERRAPGRNAQSTSRREADVPEFASGIRAGVTTGSPITPIIKNTNVRSSDYDGICNTPRPSHADYSAYAKYGEHADFAGGGHFSGRLTAPLCVAGALAIGLLSKSGIAVSAEAVEIGGETDKERFAGVIDDAKADGDSVGGIVECTVTGLPAGVGGPMFDGMENRIAKAVFGIPAVRGIEFGAGFAAAGMRGSEHNDPFCIRNGRVETKKNDHGGILGGITTGMPIVFRTAFKPTPSIGKEQDTVRLSDMTETKITVAGRHDPCVVLRAVPCVEAAAALAVLDAMMEDGIII
ncbi:MAG: chorismate synthase [Clostridia bacterium]|nr:chorismate synthase [Clostridia bacterium]